MWPNDFKKPSVLLAHKIVLIARKLAQIAYDFHTN